MCKGVTWSSLRPLHLPHLTMSLSRQLPHQACIPCNMSETKSISECLKTSKSWNFTEAILGIILIEFHIAALKKKNVISSLFHWCLINFYQYNFYQYHYYHRNTDYKLLMEIWKWPQDNFRIHKIEAILFYEYFLSCSLQHQNTVNKLTK